MTLEAAFELFKRSVLLKDPRAEVEMVKPAIKILHGCLDRPIADLHCKVLDVEYKYSLLKNPFNGSCKVIPFMDVN